MLTVIGYGDQKRIEEEYPGIRIVNTTSRSKKDGKKLSPFFLGPVRLYDDFVAKNVENAWQFAKVYEEHIGETGNPNAEYWDWAQRGWDDNWAHRYPEINGESVKGRRPEYSYWSSKKLDYVEARREIYIPVYARAVVKTDAYKTLVKLVDQEENVALLDFDGYDFVSEGVTLEEVRDNPERKMGHAFVLAMMLEGKI